MSNQICVFCSEAYTGDPAEHVCPPDNVELVDEDISAIHEEERSIIAAEPPPGDEASLGEGTMVLCPNCSDSNLLFQLNGRKKLIRECPECHYSEENS